MVHRTGTAFPKTFRAEVRDPMPMVGLAPPLPPRPRPTLVPASQPIPAVPLAAPLDERIGGVREGGALKQVQEGEQDKAKEVAEKEKEKGIEEQNQGPEELWQTSVRRENQGGRTRRNADAKAEALWQTSVHSASSDSTISTSRAAYYPNSGSESGPSLHMQMARREVTSEEHDAAALEYRISEEDTGSFMVQRSVQGQHEQPRRILRSGSAKLVTL